jgi:hypothetical protein
MIFFVKYPNGQYDKIAKMARNVLYFKIFMGRHPWTPSPRPYLGHHIAAYLFQKASRGITACILRE